MSPASGSDVDFRLRPRALWYQTRVTCEDYLAGVIGLALCCAADPAALLRRAGEMARIIRRPRGWPA